MKKLLVFASAIALIATACSDDSPTNTDTSDKWVSSTPGSYVIHDVVVHDIDSTGQPVDYPVGTDSVVAGASLSMTDGTGSTKTAVPYYQYMGGEIIDTAYFSQTGGDLYFLYDVELAAPGIDPVVLGTRWVKVADNSATGEFTGLDLLIEDITIDYNGTPLPADVRFKITGKKNGKETLTIDGKSVSATSFTNVYAVTITVTVPILGSIDIPIAVESTTKYGKDIGMVFETQDPTPISVPQLGFSFTIPGYTTTGIRFN